MANFPNGPFTITNNDTGRCLRARLGPSQEVSDHKEGLEYLQTITSKPWLELGEADGSIATAWYFNTVYDRTERLNLDQIASTAVRELQNIGNFCVAAFTNPDSFEDLHKRQMAAADVARGKRLTEAMPAQWTGTRQAWEELVEASLPLLEKNLMYFELEKQEQYELEQEQKVISSAPAQWVGAKTTLPAAIRAYDAELDKGDLVPDGDPDPSAAQSTMMMFGCGCERGAGTNYRWTTDATRIWAADNCEFLPAAGSYWTDEGTLVGRGRNNSAAQTWTLTPWTPPPASKTDGEALLRTGLFGPLGAVLGL
ncbi:hypothetical protein [Nocardia sp. NPDC050435]|uniref:hypothetical protein n=1 Tax=Nocardia sp. NPDC050435 TaxID=3155040 RepID=UPI0033FA9CFE